MNKSIEQKLIAGLFVEKIKAMGELEGINYSYTRIIGELFKKQTKYKTTQFGRFFNTFPAYIQEKVAEEAGFDSVEDFKKHLKKMTNRVNALKYYYRKKEGK